MKRSLARRVEELEARYGNGDKKLRRLAERLGIEPERFLRAVKGHEVELKSRISECGLITWEGFLLLRKLLGKSRGTPQP